MEKTSLQKHIKAALFGLAVGDALGVPVEFKSRATISRNPITDMIGFGTYHLPAGTFSDDSSLTFCLAEALTEDFDLQVIAKKIMAWYYENYWTARGTVFDVGIATRAAIEKLAQGCKPELAGGAEVSSNGNGSLMRILPVVFYVYDKPITERYEITKLVSSITHRHHLSIFACFYYIEFARQIILGKNKTEIYKNLQTEMLAYFASNEELSKQMDISIFDRLLKNDIVTLQENEIESSGYVVHTLEASIWCLLHTENYADATLKAVNLGQDTDTTGAVTGGLAGLLYGFENISPDWIAVLARKREIENLALRLANKLTNNEKSNTLF
jgi:ADP-ribosyl-[dinitrogen reductase] hydrolase